jgi:Leucine Rich repeats (2 copies)
MLPQLVTHIRCLALQICHFLQTSYGMSDPWSTLVCNVLEQEDERRAAHKTRAKRKRKLRDPRPAPACPATALLEEQPADVVDRIMAAHPTVLSNSSLAKKLSLLPPAGHAAAAAQCLGHTAWRVECSSKHDGELCGKLAAVLPRFPLMTDLSLCGPVGVAAGMRAFATRPAPQLRVLLLRSGTWQTLIATMGYAAQLTTLTCLDIAGNGRSGIATLEVTPLLHRFPVLVRLTLEGLHMKPIETARGGRYEYGIAAAIGEELSQLTNLTSLSLDQGWRGDPDDAPLLQGPADLAHWLAPLTRLRELWVIGDEGEAFHVPRLAALTQLTHLEIAFIHVGAPEAIMAVEALVNAELTSLVLSMSENRATWQPKISEEGAAAATAGLGRCTKLESLVLLHVLPSEEKPLVHQPNWWHMLPPPIPEGPGTAAQQDELARQLGNLTRLRSFMMWPAHGVKRKFGSIVGMSDLTCLDLTGDLLKDVDKAHATAQLGTMTNLVHLALRKMQGEWRYSSTVVADLAAALEPLRKLTFLDLSHNRVDDFAFLAPCTKLTNLLKLNLAHNRIRDSKVPALGEGLCPLTALTSLDLQGNTSGEEGAKALGPLLNALADLKVSWQGNRCDSETAERMWGGHSDSSQ